MKIIRITTVPISLKILLKGQLRFMQTSGFDVVGVSSNGDELLDVRDNEKIRVFPILMTRTISPIRDLRSVWDFYKFCKKERPTIVHSHTPKAGIVGMLGAKMAGVPIRLHTVAGLPLMEAVGFKRTLLNFVEKVTYACSTRVYPNSLGLRAFILEHGFSVPHKVKVIANGSTNGVNTEFFSPLNLECEQRASLRSQIGIGKDDFVFIFVGRIVKDKGIDELVSAFLELCSLHPSFLGQIKLLLVGKFESDLNPIRFDTEKEIKNNPNIIHVGFQSDVKTFFSISECLVFPSYREGFPNVVMQAGAMGLPSIVSDINGCNEIILEGENGTIVPSKNVPSLREAMYRMVADKDYYSSLKAKAREMIESRYDQKQVWESILDEYNALIFSNKKIRAAVSTYQRSIKRAVDFFVAFILCLALSPVFIVLTASLAIANRGNPFFTQPRPGKNGKIFKVIKFKTMNDLKDHQGCLLPDAERLTPLGSFIRKTSLDEIPQLLNVISGDMSLVGPRPLLVQYLSLYSPEQARRHKVRPGITGWAQINGRNAISWQQKFSYDVWYVDNISFLLDLKILFLTIKKVFVKEGVSAAGQATIEPFKGNP